MSSPTEPTGLSGSLWLPILMSVAFAAFFFYGAALIPVLRNHVFTLRDELRLGVAPDLRVLAVLLWMFAVLFTVVGCGLVWLFCHLGSEVPPMG